MSKERAARTSPMAVTRRSAWMQQRQLRNREASLLRISQMTRMLRNPSREKDRSPKAATKKDLTYSPPKQTAKKQLPKPSKPKKKRKAKPKCILKDNADEKSGEFRPDKLKRNVKTNKIVLKPKHEMKVVSRTGVRWRKRRPPQREPQSVPALPIASPHPSPSVCELVAEDDSDSLSDEALLEILTCESPVWWEDPPLGYNEDPICQRSPSPGSTTELDNENIEHLKLPEFKQKDNKFMKKRSKLESLLGNIKNKVTIDEVKANKIDSSHDNLKIKDICKPESCVDSEKKEIVSECKERLSISTESDDMACFRDEDMLKDLENMDIPIEIDDFKDSNETSSFLGKGKDLDSLDLKTEEVDTKISQSSTKTQKSTQNNDKVTIETSPNLLKTEKASTYSDNTKNNAKSGRSLLITSIDNINSPISVKSVDTSSVNSENLTNIISDTISDTNIRFIDDEDCSAPASFQMEIDKEIAGENVQDHKDKPKQLFLDLKSELDSKNVNKEKKQDGQKRKDLMTVYKIICNNKFNLNKHEFKPNTDYITVNGGKLNNFENFDNNTNKKATQKDKNDSINGDVSYYNKVHKLYRRRRPNNKIENDNQTNDESNSEHVDSKSKNLSDCETQSIDKTIKLPNTKSKYCLKCSSIFDTEKCDYCKKLKWSKNDNSFNNILEMGMKPRQIEAMVET